MNISNITLNNLSNNTSQNLSSDNLLNKTILSQDPKLSNLLINNFPSILVMTFAAPGIALTILNGKLKNGVSTDVREVKIIHKSIGYIYFWLMLNVLFLLYIPFNPNFLSYNQALTYYSISGLLLALASLFLSLRDSIVTSCRYICDDLLSLYNKLLQFKYYVSTKFQLMKKSIVKFIKHMNDGLLILYNKLLQLKSHISPTFQLIFSKFRDKSKQIYFQFLALS